MVDGYPALVTDLDFPIQTLIDRDMQNAERLWAAFHEKCPQNASPWSIDYGARSREQPSVPMLYPAAAKGSPKDWLGPALRRARWHLDREEPVFRWRLHLSWVIVTLMEKMNRPSEEEFIALADHAECMVIYPVLPFFERMLSYGKAFEKAGLLRGSTAERFLKLLKYARDVHRTTDAWQSFLWPAFRSTAWLSDAGPCWSGAVRRDIEGMAGDVSALWLGAFDAKVLPSSGLHELTGAAEKAVRALGRGAVETALLRWTGMLKKGPELTLTAEGIVILRHILVLANGLKLQAGDEILYRVVSAPWRRPEHAGWIGTALWILSSRPKDRAFACLEALVMNSATATEDVRREYDIALASFAGEARAVGIDGYRWNTEPELEAHQRRLEQLLLLCAAAVARGPYVHPTKASHVAAMNLIQEEQRTPAMKLLMAQLTAGRSWFDSGPEVRSALGIIANEILADFAKDPLKLHRAVSNRWKWIRDHKQELGPDLVSACEECFRGFGCDPGLAQRSLRRVKSVPEDQLARTIRSSPGSWKVFELAQKHVGAHGWNPEVAEALREWISTLGTSQTDNLYRAQAEWFLWLEDVLPIKLDACWGERVRKDLRSMEVAERNAWIALFGEGSFTVTEKPTQKWLKPATEAFPEIGAVKFRKRFTDWFAPFAVGEPLRLTVTGRNILRLLMWAALIARDPAVDGALAGFAKANWKTRDNQKKASQAEMAFAHVLAERDPRQALPILEKLVESGRAYPGSVGYQICQRLRLQIRPVRA
jgi:hypothetical protein